MHERHRRELGKNIGSARGLDWVRSRTLQSTVGHCDFYAVNNCAFQMPPKFPRWSSVAECSRQIGKQFGRRSIADIGEAPQFTEV